LKWRNIGPHRGGRVVAVAGDPVDAKTFYFGAVSGGVWKTTDAGNHWFNISDGYFNTAAVGAIAVSESDPNVIYTGTGESSIRSNVSHGDGVYKSTDAGQTWTNIGLSDTRHISRIRIHPNNPDLVYVAALGHAWGKNEQRGVFRSKDGGGSWEKVLYKSDGAGAIDLSMDATNPRILYAAIWQVQRLPWSMESGGPDSGIWKSTDGGDSWTDITNNTGLPNEENLGKIGISVSPANPQRVYALIEAEKGGLYRSDDGGANWSLLNSEQILRTRHWYYTHIYADPGDQDTVWVLEQQFVKSIDGGKTFTSLPVPHGDNHDIWIDPNNTDRIIEGNDGGACVSFNGGASWSTILNQPTAQFYHVTTDNQTPYNVYGSQQDNSAMRVPSIGFYGAITWNDYKVPGGGESGHIAVKPTPPYTVFGGSVGSGLGHGRFRAWYPDTDQTRNITVWPEFYGFTSPTKIHKYRFQWTFPVEISPHNPDKLYACSNVVHVSYDEGGSWEVISPDLTRNDPAHQEHSGGPISSENVGAEAYGTIFALKESPHEEGVIYSGSDDGLMYITKDGGENWQSITPPDDLLPNPPENPARISVIDVSPHKAGTVYVAANRYQHDDPRPYLLKSDDYGQSWQLITNGLADTVICRAIREDVNKPGILYAGTETGIYVSLDDGASWQSLQTNLPVCPVHDLVSKETDLVVSAHGRSFWILDDVTPLHQLQDEQTEGNRLFKPRDTIRYRINGGFGMDPQPGVVGYRGTGPVTIASRMVRDEYGDWQQQPLNAGQNPPDGVIIHFSLADKPEDEVTLTIKNSAGETVKAFSSKGEEDKKLRVKAGSNRHVWNMREEGPTERKLDDNVPPWRRFMMRMASAPRVLSGDYSVELKIGDETHTQRFSILPDPRLTVSEDDLRAQYELKTAIRDRMSEVNEALNALGSIREQVDGWVERAGNEEITQAAEALKEKIGEIEDRLRVPEKASTKGGENGLSEKFSVLAMAIDESDHAPTAQAQEVYANLAEDLTTLRYQAQRLSEDDIAAFTAKLQAAAVPLISAVPTGAAARAATGN
jgi:photosystem II stability/assembly factor-like uncharacterized protein